MLEFSLVSLEFSLLSLELHVYSRDIQQATVHDTATQTRCVDCTGNLQMTVAINDKHTIIVVCISYMIWAQFLAAYTLLVLS